MAWRPGMVLMLLVLTVLPLLVFSAREYPEFLPDKVGWVRFIVTVNDTWDPNGCIATTSTGKLVPNKKYNETETIRVGSCDHGPLVYTVVPGQAPNEMSVNLTFYSSVIEDAEPPTCQIPWNGTYVSPHPDTDPLHDSPLPGCFTTDSREGWYLTAYWFYLLDWGGSRTGLEQDN
ncbi:uncharacterized protein [Branchiostoma lanceolatum]|uniref:uncharacterized protein n=1 Tax=Branchiostoma lanceolatum TaxID=7740 RepID=UPI003451DD7E